MLARLLCLFAIVPLLVSCGGAKSPGDGSEAQTSIRIVAINPNVGRVAFDFSCAPARGNVPAPERACQAVEGSPEILTRPEPLVCWGPGWWQFTISGQLRGAPIEKEVGSCWTPQMELLDRLGIADSLEDHLLPRARVVIVSGTRREIPPGVLQPGDLVVCETNGRQLEQGVSTRPGETALTGYRDHELTVTAKTDGSVTAVCT